MRHLGSLALLPSLLALPACRAPTTRSADAAGPELGHARLELRGADGRERSFDWSARTNLVRCRHYPEAERGDYLWIRLAETGEADGDAGVRLDIDVCRLGQLDKVPTRMPAGQHGSHCADQPGFAIWWHERDAAYHSGDDGPTGAESCQLELVVEGDVVHGVFACAPLQPAPAAETQTGRGLALAAGSFACALERAPG